MQVETTVRQTMSGPGRYLHLAHNEWSPVAGWSASELLRGRSVREDQLARDAVKRSVASLIRFDVCAPKQIIELAPTTR